MLAPSRGPHKPDRTKDKPRDEDYARRRAQRTRRERMANGIRDGLSPYDVKRAKTPDFAEMKEAIRYFHITFHCDLEK